MRKRVKQDEVFKDITDNPIDSNGNVVGIDGKGRYIESVTMLVDGVPFNKPTNDGMILEEVIAFNDLSVEERKRQMEEASKPHPLAELFFRKIKEYDAIGDTSTHHLQLEDLRVMAIERRPFGRGWSCDITPHDVERPIEKAEG